MGKYNIEKISRRFFPWFWQTETNLSLIDLLMASLTEVNDGTESTEVDIRQKAGYSIQRLSLEQSLNDKFDPIDRRIQVVNGELGGTEYVFNEIETPPSQLIIYVYNEAETPAPEDVAYFFNENETGQVANVGFTVLVPSELAVFDQQIKSWIDRVAIYGTSYNIIYV